MLNAEKSGGKFGIIPEEPMLNTEKSGTFRIIPEEPM